MAVANGNGTLDETQKQANQTQLNSILSSIDRVAANTAFGTKKLLDGSTGTKTSVISGDRISSASFSTKVGTAPITSVDDLDVDVTVAATKASVTGKVVLTGATAVGAGTFSINGKQFTTDANTTRDQLVEKVNSASGETGVQVSVDGSNNLVFTSTQWGTKGDFELVDANAVVLGAAGAQTTNAFDAEADVTYTDTDGNTFTSTFDQGNGLNLRDKDGNTITLVDNGAAGGNNVATYSNAIHVSPGATSFQIGANAGQTASLSLGSFSSASIGFTTANSNISGADTSTALAQIDSAISNVANARGQIGSFMKNTLESNVRSLGIARENLAATESSIREIDVAEEMTNYTKLQILQQSGLSMLSQANSGPQAVLSLLR